MLISSQSDYCLEGKMATLKNNVPKMGKNVARKSTSNRPLKNVPSVKPNDIAFSSAKIVELTQSQKNYYANFESVRYSSPQTYHLSNSARYSDHLYSKPGPIHDSYVDNSEEECDNIDGVFSISGSMLKFEKVAQMSPTLSEDSDDAIDPSRVLYFPVKYEFPSFAVKQYTPPRFSDSLYTSGDYYVSDSDTDEVESNSPSPAKNTPVSPIKNKLSIKKELFRDSDMFPDPSCSIINNDEPDNECPSEQAKNVNETYLKIEYVTTLSPDNDLTSEPENVTHEANGEKLLDSHIRERITETEDYTEINAGKEIPETKEVDKQGSNKTNIEQIIEKHIEDKVIEPNIDKNNETIIDKPVIKTEEKSEEPIEEKPIINQESNNSDDNCDNSETKADEKSLIVNKTKKDKEPVPKKKAPMLIKGKVNKQNKKTLMLPTRPTRSTMIHFVDETVDDSLVKRVPIDRKTKKHKGATPPPVTRRARPFSNRRSKANLNLAEDSSDNSDSNCSSSEATENKAAKEKTKSNDTQKSKSDTGLKKSKSESVEDLKSNSEKPKDSKKSVKIKPEINEGMLLYVEAAKKTNIMRDGKILKDKKDLLKDVDSTIDKNLPLEVDKQGFEIQQSLTEEILLDQALRLAHQRTSPRRRPLLTTSQAKEIVNSLTCQTRAAKKSMEKKSSNSSGSPGKQKHGTDSNLIEADLSTNAETESDNESKQVPSIGKMSSSPIKSEPSSNSKQQEKKTSKPKKINIKSILKKMADRLDPDDMDLNTLSKTFENVIKNITNLSNSEASDSDNPEDKKVITRAKKKTKTKSRKKTKSNYTQEDFSNNKSTLPVNNPEDLIPVIIIKNKSEAILRERGQRISNSDSSKEDSIATVIPEQATNLEPPVLVPEVETSMQDPPTNIPELEPCLLDPENVKHPKNESNIPSETTSIPQNTTEDSSKRAAVVTSEDPYIQKVTTSEELQCEKKKLVLDESCRSLIIDESLNETSINVDCKSLTSNTPLSESSNDEVTSTTEIDKTENINKGESTMTIEDSPASPDEISEPLPDSKKSAVIEIIEIEDEVHSSTKIVEQKIPFLDNCDSTESEAVKDFPKDNFSQLSFNSASNNKATLHTPESIDSIPTKGGKLSEAQENRICTSDSSNDALPEEITTNEAVEKTPLLSNPEIAPSAVQDIPTSSTASLALASSVASANPAVYTNVPSGSNISSPINIFPQPNSNGVYSLSSDATKITSIVTTSTLLQHISQQSLTSSINLLDPAYNTAHLANYFNQTQNFQYPLSTNSLQYSSTSSSSEVTQLAQPKTTSSSAIDEQSKPKPKSIDVPLSILARDPRLRKKSVRIIVDNVEFTTPVSGSNPPVPSISSDPRGLVTPRVPSVSTASGTPKIQAVAPFSKQVTEEPEPDESGSVTPENVDNSEEGNEKAESPVHEVPKKKPKKKEIDKELLYKTPLCDLHEETSERSSYTRKPKRPAPSRFEPQRPSKFERTSYNHHEPYREQPNRNYNKIPETDHYNEIINGHYPEESHEYVPAALRRPGEKLEGYRRKEEFPHHSRRPDHFSRRDYEDTRRRDTSDRRPLLEHGFGGRFNNRYKEYSLDQTTDYKYRRPSNNYPRYDYAHKKVDGKFPSHYETGDVDEDGQSSSRPYYRRRHLHGNDGFSSTQKKDEEELFRRRWEENGEDWKLRRALLDDSPPFSRSRSVERPHGPGRGLDLESPLSPDI